METNQLQSTMETNQLQIYTIIDLFYENGFLLRAMSY
jgi:hypothetical protein